MTNLARQYRTPQAPPDPKVKPKAAAEAKPYAVGDAVVVKSKGKNGRDRHLVVHATLPAAKGETKPASARGTKNGTGNPVASIPVPKRSGRPPKPKQEPWAAAGVSRRTWFRQQKVKAASP